MSKHHGLYKFVTCDTNEIIYIGKSNNNLKSRVADHIRGKGIDEKFNAYKGNYKVYVTFLPNTAETDILERALINKYKPILNVTDNYEGMSNLIQVEEPQWIEFDKAFPEPEPDHNPKPVKKKQNLRSEDICIGKIFDKVFYLTNQRYVKEHGKLIDRVFFDTTDEALEYIKYAINLCKKHGTYNDEHHEYIVPAKYDQEFFSFFGLGPALLMHTDSKDAYYSIINTISGYDNELEKIYFNQTAIDICNLIIDELSDMQTTV
jgi:predicted GIY-YIG superfamily endonuclease